MAVMDSTNRTRCRNQYMREQVTSAGITKTDLAAAVAAIDQWIEDNTTSFNTALPLPFRTAANATEKTVLFCYVAMRRAGRLHADEDG